MGLIWGGVAPAMAQVSMPKNVILMISDGQGYNTVDATTYYTGHQAIYEYFPVQLGASTFSAGKEYPNNNQFAEGQGGYDPAKAWGEFDYVKNGATDSASAATALATGQKTYDAAIGVDVFKKDVTNIVEIASDYGKATGVVTSVEFSHATPAGMVAHDVSRNNYAAIALDMYASDLDVIMGCGNPDFDDNGDPATAKSANYVGGTTAWEDLKTPGGGYSEWTLIQSKTDFEALANGTFNLTTSKLLGVPQAYSTLQQSRTKTPGALLYGDPLNDNVPSLAVMTEGALNLLGKDKDGFFLMVEGGAVDWANHANDMTRMLEEQLDFNASVEAVVEWVYENSSWKDTLLIITADHECGGLWGPDQALTPLVDNGAGNLPGYKYYSGNHTNALVPVYAVGKGSMNLNHFADQTDPVYGKYVDNTEIFRTMLGDVPWRTYEYSYTYLYDDTKMAAYLKDPAGFDACDFYTGTMYAPLSMGYFVGQVMDMGSGAHIITEMDYKAKSMGKSGRVYVDNYHDAGKGDFAPMGSKNPLGWGYLGSETGFIIKKWVEVYRFGKGEAADALPLYALPPMSGYSKKQLGL
ncbi:MAG: alkaline phosphatase [Desulfobaccales bacterium]